MTTHITKQRGFWYYNRKVPLDLQDLDPRRLIQQSTKIRVADDPKGTRASRVAMRLDQVHDDYWRDLGAGRVTQARQRLNDAIRRSRMLGFDYAPTREIAAGALDSIMARLETLERRGLIDSDEAQTALLGDAPPATMTVWQMWDEYESHERANNRKKSADQMRKWTNTRKRAVTNFVAVIGGDRDVMQIKRADAVRFHDWWKNRILEDDYDPSSANADISVMRKMFKVVGSRHQLQFDPIFTELRFKPTKGKRPAFKPEFVRDTILRSAALHRLNAEARRALYVLAETGLRVAEVANLDGRTIHLDGDVPHVSIEPLDRELKTASSVRQIPLTGMALKAMQKQPKGFPSYRDSDNLSATLNKFLDVNGLLPSEKHSLYSLRHCFKDRLRAINPGDELTDMLMGHAIDKPDYGSGFSLQQKQEVLQRISFGILPSIV